MKLAALVGTGKADEDERVEEQGLVRLEVDIRSLGWCQPEDRRAPGDHWRRRAVDQSEDREAQADGGEMECRGDSRSGSIIEETAAWEDRA